GDLPENALDILLQLGDEAFKAAGTSPALLALWRPRFERAARWFLANEKERRGNAVHIAIERKGEMTLPGPAGDFTLGGRADRIDFLADGSADIIDYKSGSRIPGHKEVAVLNNPQLPLEAAMLLQKGFPELTADRVNSLIYLQLTGAEPPGSV